MIKTDKCDRMHRCCVNCIRKRKGAVAERPGRRTELESGTFGPGTFGSGILNLLLLF